MMSVLVCMLLVIVIILTFPLYMCVFVCTCTVDMGDRTWREYYVCSDRCAQELHV